MIWDNFSIFRTNCAIACGTPAHMLRGFSRMSCGKKWCSKFLKSFMLLAHYSTPLWLLEFCLSIFVVSCSSLNEDSTEFRYVPLYFADQFIRTSHYSTLNFIYEKTYNFSITQLKDGWTSKFFSSCHTLTRILQGSSRTKSKNEVSLIEFRLNCKQHLKFHLGPISDNYGGRELPIEKSHIFV